MNDKRKLTLEELAFAQAWIERDRRRKVAVAEFRVLGLTLLCSALFLLALIVWFRS